MSRKAGRFCVQNHSMSILQNQLLRTPLTPPLAATKRNSVLATDADPGKSAFLAMPRCCHLDHWQNECWRGKMRASGIGKGLRCYAANKMTNIPLNYTCAGPS